MPSVEPVVKKAQHEPHWPWFLTGVTAPPLFQSPDTGGFEAFLWRSVSSTFFVYLFTCAVVRCVHELELLADEVGELFGVANSAKLYG